MSHFHRTSTSVITIGVGLASPAFAQQVTADPDRISTILRARGMPVTLTTAEDDGSPEVRTQFKENAQFDIYFAGCVNGKACKTLQLSAAFDDKVSGDQLLAWNRDVRFTRAYFNASQLPELSMDIAIGIEGVPRPYFESYLDLWGMALAKFDKHIAPN